MPLAVVKAADAPAPFGMQRIYEGQHGLRVAATAAASASGSRGLTGGDSSIDSPVKEPFIIAIARATLAIVGAVEV